jgi:hypothetical protein
VFSTIRSLLGLLHHNLAVRGQVLHSLVHAAGPINFHQPCAAACTQAEMRRAVARAGEANGGRDVVPLFQTGLAYDMNPRADSITIAAMTDKAQAQPMVLTGRGIAKQLRSAVEAGIRSPNPAPPLRAFRRPALPDPDS